VWGNYIRLSLQPVLKVPEHLTTRWLAAGYHGLTFFFAAFTGVFLVAALH